MKNLLLITVDGLLQYLPGILGGGTFASAVIFGLKWIRYRGKDKSDIDKTDAEAEKIKSEARDIRAKADVTVAEAALKLAERLGQECDMTKRQLEKTQQDLLQVTAKLQEVQFDLERQIEKNNLMATEIIRLTSELDKYKTNKDLVK